MAMILKMAFVLTKRILTALTITRGHRNDYSRIQKVKLVLTVESKYVQL